MWTVVSGKAQKAEEQLRDNSQLLQIRMQNAYNAVTEAQQQLQIAQRGIEQAEENLRLHRDYYRAGTTTMSSLLEAQPSSTSRPSTAVPMPMPTCKSNYWSTVRP